MGFQKFLMKYPFIILNRLFIHLFIVHFIYSSMFIFNDDGHNKSGYSECVSGLTSISRTTCHVSYFL